MSTLYANLGRKLSFAYIIRKENLNPRNIYRTFKARGLIKSLNLFDEEYYLTQNPDVKTSNLDPLDHYIYHGWKEDRTPSKKFDGKFYLIVYPDVRKSNVNPLVHYVLHGKKEGRFPNGQAKKDSQNEIQKLEKKIDKQNRMINYLKRKMRKEVRDLKREMRKEARIHNREFKKYTRVFNVGHVNKEKLTCEIELFKGLGVTREKRSPQIIVSLTSYPERIYDIHYCLYSLLIQSFKPDRLILWLSKEEFPNLEEDLPSNILNLKEHGLEISWTEENFRSYDKLIHALKEYPNDIIVTTDDDVFYPENWLEKLYENYDGINVIAHRAHLITFESGSPKPYKQWEKSTGNDEISFLNFFTGVGGVLYPPNVFYKDVLKDELFLKLSPCADDIWFWAMLVLNDRKVKVVKNGYKKLNYINPERELNYNEDGTLYKDNALHRNDDSISALFEYYPEIKDKLLEEIRFDKFESKNYWENRYKQGDNSGVGSYGFFADFKASIINDFVKSHDVETVIEFGHGDGNQLKLANYKEYMGFDVSKTAVELCRETFKEDKTKCFYLLEEYDNQKADLTLSLDVIYHLIEDNVFEEYMERLFSASDGHVIIYSSNTDEMKDKAKHVKHRKFTDWIEKNLTNWKLIDVIKNKYPFDGNYKESSFSDFYFYEKVSAPSEYCQETEDKLPEEVPPNVSVIIPVYNREKYLKPCLDSVINQTLKNIEIICINDGSTDGSLEILEEYGRKDGRIKIIDQKNQGPGLARTIGLKIAKGEYIGFVDSDDWIDLNFYEKLFTEAKKQDADLARTLYVFEYPEHSKEMNANKTILEKKSKGELLNVNEHSVVIWNAIYKREYLQKNNIYFDKLQGVVDVPFTAKATYYSKKTIPVTGTYYHFRTEVENKVTTFNKERVKEMLKANKITLDFINSVKYENKTDYLIAFKRVIWRYDETFGRSLKLDDFDKKDQESYFNEVVQGFKSCKYKEDLEKDHHETYFEFLKKNGFNEYLKYQLQKN